MATEAAPPPQERRRLRPTVFALTWGLPLLAWQAVFFLAPLVFLILMSFWIVRNYQLRADYTTSNWTEIFTTDYFWTGYQRTLWYALIAAVVAVALAFPFAYALAFKFGASGRRFALFLLITPFFTSYLVRTYSWQTILADNGLVNNLLRRIGLGEADLLHTLLATQIGYMTLVFPLVTLLLLASLVNVDRNLVEAANNLGAGRLRTVFTVVVPAARVGIVFGWAFAFILAFGDFVAPALLGGGNPPTLSILIIDTVKSASNWPQASVIALSMVVTLMVIMFASFRLAFPPKKAAR